MEESEKKSSELPITAIISIVLALLGVLVQQLNPLDSPRPTIRNEESSEYVNIEDVDARLWQDPFTAISSHDPSKDKTENCIADKNPNIEAGFNSNEKCLSDHRHTINALARSMVEMSGKIRNITVLGVMVFSGSYAENIEARRRTRYAVLSGLAVTDYAPVDAEHIGYFNRPENIRSLPEKIPFEWFNDVNDDSSVLLLWLDEAAFASTGKPLETAGRLVDSIKNHPDLKNTSELTFKFIGPAGSGTLQNMIDEIKSNAGAPLKLFECVTKKRNASDCRFKLYDATASGDWPGLNIPPTEMNIYDDKPHLQLYLESLKKQDLASLITRTSLTDYHLARAMLKELQLRGIRIHPYEHNELEPYVSICRQRNNKHHIVIISEWDTLYGRAVLPKSLKEALVPDRTLCNTQNENEADYYNENWIHSFSYMRGLDGIVPGEGKTTAEEADANKDKDQKNNAEINQERPEGQSQQDYLRRLATHIAELKQELEDNHKDHEIMAIGVLGSDAYDKLMILKALRPSFPKAIFFTTDLDTRLMHPKEFDITRNLLVAASFDLHLADNIQKSIPPFRDSYQTANFFCYAGCLK